MSRCVDADVANSRQLKPTTSRPPPLIKKSRRVSVLMSVPLSEPTVSLSQPNAIPCQRHASRQQRSRGAFRIGIGYLLAPSESPGLWDEDSCLGTLLLS